MVLKTRHTCRLALAALAAALTLGACQKEETPSDGKFLRIEVENSGDGSKMETDGLQVHWSQGDAVGIKWGNYPILFSGGSAGVGNINIDGIGGIGYACKCNRFSTVRGNGKAFNAYFPPSIANYDEEYDGSSYQYDTYNDQESFITLTLPSRYESSFVGGRQQIDLPMVGTYYYCASGQYTANNEDVALGREVLRFQHLTAALLVKVRNDSGEPLLLDRVSLTSDYYRLSGPADTKIQLDFQRSGIGDIDPADIYRAVSVPASVAATDDEKQVEVVFPEPVVVAPGAILPVQVPILPMGPYGFYESLQVTDNLTVRVEGRNESTPGIIGSRRLTFQHTVEMTGGIARKKMKTIQIKMDPASERVTVLDPAFTVEVNSNSRVHISNGNLQYRASDATWRFAPQQYDHVGAANENISSTYDGWIDLFGWGTSGYAYGAANYQPWSTSDEGTYGPSGGIIHGQSDWGYNAISGGGDSENSGWRTLSRQEWECLVYRGDNTSHPRHGKWTLATVCNVPGMVIVPDNWSTSLTPSADSFTANTYDAAAWASMEAEGAVFLPAAGCRYSASVYAVGETGFYWLRDYSNTVTAITANVGPAPGIDVLSWPGRYAGHSVRLVRDAN